MWHTVKGYKAHLGTEFASKIGKVTNIFSQNIYQYVVVPTEQTAYNQQLKS